ncbi:MAG: hypothetical protein N2690_08885 [Rhodocyclaceae bacterium]|nr:hypothetical protein [Rhodocyclaceae bacterium]
MPASSFQVKVTVSAARQPHLHAWLQAVPPGARSALLRSALEALAASGGLPALQWGSEAASRQAAPPPPVVSQAGSIAAARPEAREPQTLAQPEPEPQRGAAALATDEALRLMQRLNRFG